MTDVSDTDRAADDDTDVEAGTPIVDDPDEDLVDGYLAEGETDPEPDSDPDPEA